VNRRIALFHIVLSLSPSDLIKKQNKELQKMYKKHSLDFRAITNVAHHESIFIFVRHTQDLLRKLRSFADESTAPLVRSLIPVLVTIGILAVIAMIFCVIYERVSVFFSAPRGLDHRPLFYGASLVTAVRQTGRYNNKAGRTPVSTLPIALCYCCWLTSRRISP
jgi:hypothetical protein